MKLKINKACDLSSISVLPPQSRRASTVPNGLESSVFGKIQASQLRSQPSQQSFSQGVSSQHGMFSQFSQSSLDEIVTNDQRYCSQERENSVKKISCLPPVNCIREESQMPISLASTSLMRKWNSASISDHRCQISEELEHRIGVMETSLNRFGRILDSIQSDIIQVNKGTKEASMEMEGIRQKLIIHDNSVQLMMSKNINFLMQLRYENQNKGQEDIKSSLDGGLKSISDQLGLDPHGERLREISLMLSAFPEKIDACLTKLKLDLCNTFTQEMQEMSCSLKSSNQNFPSSTVLPATDINHHAIPHQMPDLKNPVVSPKLCGKATPLPKIKMGSWTSVKHEKSAFRASNKEHTQKRVPPAELEGEWRVVVESDEDIDGGFSCLLEEKETEDMGNYSMAEAKEETERILRKARRRKRKYCNTIIIN